MAALIFLVGMPACGKSFLGKILSKKFSGRFDDTDHRLINLHGEPISQLFEQYGQLWFRQQEAQVLRQIVAKRLLLDCSHAIISTGGGLPCFNQNMDFMLSNGLVVFVNVSLEILSERILMRKNHRPMFAGLQNHAQVMGQLEILWQQRSGFYNQAHIILPGSEPLQAFKIIGEWVDNN